VDDTLFKLGTMTDYNKLRMKAICLVLGWSVIVMLLTCSAALFIEYEYDYDIATAICVIFIRSYVFHINTIGDLTTASILALVHLFTYIIVFILYRYFISLMCN